MECAGKYVFGEPCMGIYAVPNWREKSNFDLNLLSISHRYLLCFPFIYVFLFTYFGHCFCGIRMNGRTSQWVNEWVSKKSFGHISMIIIFECPGEIHVQTPKMLMHHLLLTINNSRILYALPFGNNVLHSFILWPIHRRSGGFVLSSSSHRRTEWFMWFAEIISWIFAILSSFNNSFNGTFGLQTNNQYSDLAQQKWSIANEE